MSFLCMITSARSSLVWSHRERHKRREILCTLCAQRQKLGERTDDDKLQAGQLIELLRRPGDLFLGVKEVLLSVVTFIRKQYHGRSVRFLTILTETTIIISFHARVRSTSFHHSFKYWSIQSRENDRHVLIIGIKNRNSTGYWKKIRVMTSANLFYASGTDSQQTLQIWIRGMTESSIWWCHQFTVVSHMSLVTNWELRDKLPALKAMLMFFAEYSLRPKQFRT